MAAANCLLTEDQLLCSICLDVFIDPVTTPCGHNFCKNCITEHWNSDVQCLCPICKRLYETKPELQVNTFISEVAAQFRQEAQQKASSSSSSEQQDPKPGEVFCDFCTGTKLKALKSCLVCLSAYCETHLEPHLKVSGLKRHQLIDPVENLEGRMCTKHDKLLELFCKTDQTCVCMLCSVLDHKTHDVVPLKEEYEEKKTELGQTEAEVQQMIRKRQLKIQEIKSSVDLSKENADRLIEEGVQVFTTLKASVERSQAEFIRAMKEKHRKTEKKAEDFIKDLEQEIFELKKRRSEVEEFLRSEDHLHVLQSISFLKAVTPAKEWTDISVHPTSYEGTGVRAVAQLEETITEQTKKMIEAELKRVKQYEVQVTLNPDIVYPNHIQHKDARIHENCRCVHSKQGFSSGRFYFQVQINRWSTWTLGVAGLLTDTKSETLQSHMAARTKLHPRHGKWTVCTQPSGEYFAAADPPVRLCLKHKPENVGVFVNYDEGLVSFYDVDAAALIYSFTGCSFAEKINPFFSPCPNNGFTFTNHHMCVLQ